MLLIELNIFKISININSNQIQSTQKKNYKPQIEDNPHQ